MAKEASETQQISAVVRFETLDPKTCRAIVFPLVEERYLPAAETQLSYRTSLKKF
jgi:hypothetical protein